MKSIILFFLLSMALSLSAQIANWENYEIPSTNYIKDAGQSNGFSSDVIFIDNFYTDNPPNSYWSGWILSNGVNQTQEGYSNEHSVYAGSGANNTDNFAVAYIFGEGIIKFNDYQTNHDFKGMYVTNNTYAYLSMKNGDFSAKKFGGESGSDPDYFLLTIRGFIDGALSTQKIEFYLADFRFDNDELDYIIDEWEYIDLTPLSNADSLSLVLSSSDVGAFGMNTPAYVCVDEIETKLISNSSDILPENLISVTQITESGFFMVEVEKEGQFAIYSQNGSEVRHFRLRKGRTEVNMEYLPSGMYFYRFSTEKGSKSGALFK